MADDAAAAPPPPIEASDVQFDSVEECDAVAYDPDTETYRASFDGSTESVPVAVVVTVAAVAETRPEELPQLNSVIDPESLEKLVEPAAPDATRSDVHVSFTLDDYSVTVHSSGTIIVRPPHAD